MAIADLAILSVFSTEGANQSQTCTIAGASATATSGLWVHHEYDWTDVTGWTAVDVYADMLAGAFSAATGTGVSVVWSNSTGLYTVSRATNFTMAFSSASDLRMRATLGFTSNKSGANSYTSDVRPYYLIIPAIGALTATTDVFDPDDLAEEAVSDGGEAFVVSRSTSDQLWDWSHAMETKAAVMSRAAAAAVPWTWQHFHAHHRTGLPFVVASNNVGEGAVHRLRAKGVPFRPERVEADYDALWTIRLQTRFLADIFP